MDTASNVIQIPTQYVPRVDPEVVDAAKDTRWYPLRFHHIQNLYWNSISRINIVPAGRRSGKSEIAKRKIVLRSFLPPELGGSPFSDPRYFCAAPTRDQAKRIFWDDLKKLIPPDQRSKPPSESHLIIWNSLGAEIHVVGMDKPERIEGTPWDGGILDEYGNMKSQAWPENVRPALSDRAGWCDMIGVPEGRNHYYKEYKKAKVDETKVRQAFTWKSADILPAEEIAEAKKDLDDLTYLQEYEGSFINFTGRAYWTYVEELHVGKIRQLYNPKAPLLFMLDFNVDPGVAAVGQEMVLPIDGGTVGTGLIGEVWVPRGSNTIIVSRRLARDWKDHEGRIICYGDATGGNRGTAKVEGSDWELVRRVLYKRFGSKRVSFKVKLSNPRERDRVNAVNSRLLSTNGEVRMMVDGKNCPHIMDDFERVTVIEGGSGELDKKTDTDLTHLSDAIGYYCNEEYPVKKTYESSGQRYWK